MLKFKVEFTCEHPNVWMWPAHDCLQFSMETLHVIVGSASLSVNGERLRPNTYTRNLVCCYPWVDIGMLNSPVKKVVRHLMKTLVPII